MEGFNVHMQKHKQDFKKEFKSTGIFKGIPQGSKKSENKRYTCNKCGKRFHYPKSLMNHEESRCDQNKIIIKKEAMDLTELENCCKKCGKRYSIKAFLEKHEKKCKVTSKVKQELDDNFA